MPVQTLPFFRPLNALIIPIEYDNTTLDDQESTAVSVSYTMGSLGIKAAMTSVDNIAGAATNDREGYQLTVAFAF